LPQIAFTLSLTPDKKKKRFALASRVPDCTGREIFILALNF